MLAPFGWWSLERTDRRPFSCVRVVYRLLATLLVLSACTRKSTSPEPPEHSTPTCRGGKDAVGLWLSSSGRCSVVFLSQQQQYSFALSAAHCVGTDLGEVYQLDEMGQQHKIGEVDALHAHPAYRGSAEADLVVLRIHSSAVIPACVSLEKVPLLSEGERLVALGHGRNASKEEEKPRAKQLALLEQSSTTLTLANVDTESVCFGDSGGPILTADRRLLVGLVSRGTSGDCRSELLATYLNQEKRNFIFGAIRKLTQVRSCADCRSEANESNACREMVTVCHGDPECRSAIACAERCAGSTCEHACLTPNPLALRLNKCSCASCSQLCSQHWRCHFVSLPDKPLPLDSKASSAAAPGF